MSRTLGACSGLDVPSTHALRIIWGMQPTCHPRKCAATPSSGPSQRSNHGYCRNQCTIGIDCNSDLPRVWTRIPRDRRSGVAQTPSSGGLSQQWDGNGVCRIVASSSTVNSCAVLGRSTVPSLEPVDPVTYPLITNLRREQTLGSSGAAHSTSRSISTVGGRPF